MTDPYRALCAELVDVFDNPSPPQYKADVLTRARALLAQPELVEPTDKELLELMPRQMRDDLARAARAMIGFDSPKAVGACRVILNRHAVDHARAVLAEYGTPTPEATDD